MMSLRSPRNMCSVRVRPMPSAPSSSDRRASAGLSALARTPRRRTSSAQPRTVARSPVVPGRSRVTAPSMTSPVPPSMETTSPSCSTRSVPATLTCLAAASMCSASTPQTQGLPMPRAMTAAWLVLPPWLVRMPSAAVMPARSSGVVSQRTRTQACPASAAATASAAEKTTAPTAAPGLALRPRAMTLRSAPLAICGCMSWSSWAGLMRSSASSRVMRPSRSRSTAILRAAAAVRLPTRVCSM